jgi:hypothetical protein
MAITSHHDSVQGIRKVNLYGVAEDSQAGVWVPDAL